MEHIFPNFFIMIVRLSEQDGITIIENTHQIFHSAGSIRFNDSLPYAIHVNIRLTRVD